MDQESFEGLDIRRKSLKSHLSRAPSLSKRGGRASLHRYSATKNILRPRTRGSNTISIPRFYSPSQRLKYDHPNGAKFVSPLSPPEAAKLVPVLSTLRHRVTCVIFAGLEAHFPVGHINLISRRSHVLYYKNISLRSSIACPELSLSAKSFTPLSGDATEEYPRHLGTTHRLGGIRGLPVTRSRTFYRGNRDILHKERPTTVTHH
jgi:hypothetical protein